MIDYMATYIADDFYSPCCDMSSNVCVQQLNTNN